MKQQYIFPAVLYFDEETNQVKGKCKLLPLRPYVVLEIKGNIVYLQNNLQGKVKFLSGGDSPRPTTVADLVKFQNRQ